MQYMHSVTSVLAYMQYMHSVTSVLFTTNTCTGVVN